LITRNFDVVINLSEDNVPLISAFRAVQNDLQVYHLTVRIIDGNSEISYAAVHHATIAFSKYDNNVVQGNMTVGANSLTYTMGTNEIAYPGPVTASIQLFGASGERLTSARFKFDVIKDLITPSAVESTSEFPMLQQLKEDMDVVLNEFPAIKDFFEDAEVAEGARVTAEGIRQTNETARQNAAAGYAATMGQYASTMGQYATAEAARAAAASAQATAEIIRQTQETARQSSIADIEHRFTQLTTSQQQASEVIDARSSLVKGIDYPSLDARLEAMEGDIAAPQYTTPQEVTAPVVSLPATAKKGELRVTVKGNIINQLANNGADYSNWVLDGVSGSTKGVNGIHLVQSGNSETADLPTNLKPSTLYTLVYTVRNTNTDGGLVLSAYGALASSQGGVDITLSKALGLHKVTFTTVAAITVNVIRFRISSSGVDGTYIDFSDVMLYEGDQTQNPLTDRYMGYGVKDVGPTRLTSTNKNIWGSKKAADDVVSKVKSPENAYLAAIDGRNCLVLRGHSAITSKVFYDRFESNTQYTARYIGKRSDPSNNGGYLRFAYSDGTFTTFSVSADWTGWTIPSTPGKTVVAITANYGTNGLLGYYDYDTLQIEKGASYTGYVPYASTSAYLPAIGGSLPNGVRDNTNLQTGIHTQQTKPYVLQASDITTILTNAVNVDRIIINKRTDELGYGTVISPPTHRYFPGFNPGQYADSVGAIGIMYDAATNYGIIVAKGAYANLAAAQAAFAGTKIYYEAAAPLPSQIEGCNSLIVEPSGSIIVEPGIIKEDRIYSATGITVKDAIRPIQNIERLWRLQGLQEIEVDISKAVYTIGATTFTITGAATGEEYRYVYETTDKGLLPTMEYSYPLNLLASHEQVVDLSARLKAELGDVWLTLLPLADKELAMYMITAITVPASATAADCANKINEIINVWKG
jgi:hypothetical protein